MKTMKLAAVCLFLVAAAGCAQKDAPNSVVTPEPQAPVAAEAPEGVVYCGGGEIKRTIEYAILDNAADQWDARVTVNGDTQRAMTSYSYFGNAKPPQGFVVALLGEDRAEYLVFKDGARNWLELGDYQYDQCN